jgi:hypothetical protein
MYFFKDKLHHESLWLFEMQFIFYNFYLDSLISYFFSYPILKYFGSNYINYMLTVLTFLFNMYFMYRDKYMKHIAFK